VSGGLIQLKRHVTRLKGCSACPDMIGPVVTGLPVMSPVMLIGQAPGVREGPAGKPFAWTAGKTMFGWFDQLGLTEEEFRQHVYMAAVCRCFPGKADGGGDRVPSDDEVKRCSKHLASEARILRPRLVIPVGKLAIEQLFPETEKLTEIVGTQQRAQLGGIELDAIPLPHPSGASTWHRTEPGKTLLVRALARIAQHEAWQALLAAKQADLAKQVRVVQVAPPTKQTKRAS
jgi:uracil-DNA glycosylase